MLMKTKDRNCTISEEPGMLKKNKPLIGANRECYRKQKEIALGGVPNKAGRAVAKNSDPSIC
jgi:hypothetical protein